MKNIENLFHQSFLLKQSFGHVGGLLHSAEFLGNIKKIPQVLLLPRKLTYTEIRINEKDLRGDQKNGRKKFNAGLYG